VYIPGSMMEGTRPSSLWAIRTCGSPPAPIFGKGGLTEAELAGDFSQSKIILWFPGRRPSRRIRPSPPWKAEAHQPGAFLSPSALRLYKYFQMPTVAKSGDRSFENKTRNSFDRNWTLRGDHTLAQKNTLSLSYVHSVQQVDPLI